MFSTFLKKLGLVIAELLLFALLAGIVAAGIILPVTAIFHLENTQLSGEKSPYTATFANYIPMNIAYISAIFLLRKYIFKRSFSEAGLRPTNLAADLPKGFGWGALLIISGYVILLIINKLATQSATWDAYLFFGFLLLFLFQSFSEEVLSRGFLLPAIAHRFGNFWGLFISSILFSVLHFANPNFNVIGGINVFLAGWLMGVLYLKYKNLWACTGLHWGWNFTQATLFDFNVSGMDVYSFIRFKPLAPAWLTGGLFGFEGSILSVIFLVIASIYFGRGLYNASFFRLNTAGDSANAS